MPPPLIKICGLNTPESLDAAIKARANYAGLNFFPPSPRYVTPVQAAALAARNGIEPHAGHGLTYDNVGPIAAIPQIRELNIGHFLIGEAIFVGLAESIGRMRSIMDAAR